MSDDTVTAGVLVDGALRGWQVTSLQRMVAAGATIETVIENEAGGSSLLKTLVDDPAYFLVAATRELSIRRSDASFIDRTPIDAIDVLDGTTRVSCSPVHRDDYGVELPDRVVGEYCVDLDVLVRFGFGIVRGAVLDAPRFGVLSYHHGDVRRYRGRPAVFWEFMNDEPQVGVTLQRLTDDLDGGGIVALRTFVRREHDTYADIFTRVYEGSTDLLAEATESIRRWEFDPELPDELGELYTMPGWRTTTRFLLKSAKIAAARWRTARAGGSPRQDR